MSAKSILIVDDDKAFAKALATRCEALGLNAQVSSEGLHALMTILQEPPDLVILDVNMPGGDGLSVCEKLATDQRLAPIPVIILTGKADEATVERCEELGAHYVYKGLDTWDGLKPLICELLEIERAAGGAGDPSRTTASRAEPVCSDPKPPRVLVIDDDLAFSKALKIRLKARGIEVLRATSGMQGYWMALKERPDVITLDYTMPEGRGNYILGRLQSHSITKKIPVIVVTGRSIGDAVDFGLQREMLGQGAKAFLPKPLDFEALVKLLREYINVPLTVSSGHHG